MNHCYCVESCQQIPSKCNAFDPATPKLVLPQGGVSDLFKKYPQKISFFADVGLSGQKERGLRRRGVAHMAGSPDCVGSGGIRARNDESIVRSSYLAEKDGVIIVDHGSRRAQSNRMLDEFVVIFKEKTGYPIVEPAHMELADPTIDAAFDLCVAQGATRVIISPYFLFPGRHWERDIPALAAAAAKKHPSTPFLVTAPIGLHELMVTVIQDRMNHCLSKVAGDSAECKMCVGTGLCQQKAFLDSEPQLSSLASD